MKKILFILAVAFFLAGCSKPSSQGGAGTNAAMGTNMGGTRTNMPSGPGTGTSTNGSSTAPP